MTNLQRKKFAFEKAAILKDKLEKKDVFCGEIEPRQYYFEILCSYKKNNLKVLIYFGKKGCKIVIQGNNETELYSIVYEAVNGKIFNSNHIEEPDSYIGADESGKGDFFGPLVAAAIVTDQNLRLKMKKIGVRDCKEISDGEIRFLSEKIKELTPDSFAILSLEPEIYNKLFDKYKNLNIILTKAHASAIEKLKDKSETVIVDKFGNEKLIAGEFKEKSINIKLIQTYNAERYVGVAAASILARSEFLKWFDKMEAAGLKFTKGSSIQTERFLKEYLKRNNGADLKKFAKLHFKTLNKVMNKNA